MSGTQRIVALVLKAVALGMAVASMVLDSFGEISVGTTVTLLGIGLLALSVASLQKIMEASRIRISANEISYNSPKILPRCYVLTGGLSSHRP